MSLLKSLLCAGMLAIALAVSHVHAAEVTRFTANGDAVAGNIFDPVGGGMGYLNVYRTGTAASPTTSLALFFEHCDDVTALCTGVYGSGQIPNNDFRVNAFHASVTTNNFTAVSYIRPLSGDATSVTVITGDIKFSWEKSGDYAGESQGTSQTTTPTVTLIQTGRHTYVYADGSGSFFGLPQLVGHFNTIGTQFATAITITRR